MGRTTFDWRWIILIVVALIFFGQVRIAPSAELGVVLLGLGAYWAVQAGLGPWRGRGSMLGSTKVTYWRGQRLEIPQSRRSRLRTLSATSVAVSALYLSLGLGCLYAAVRLLILLFTR